jgi:hypothetical protein
MAVTIDVNAKKILTRFSHLDFMACSVSSRFFNQNLGDRLAWR